MVLDNLIIQYLLYKVKKLPNYHLHKEKVIYVNQNF